MKDIIFWGATGQSKVLRECMMDEFNLVALFDNDKNVPSPFIDIPIYYRKEGFEEWLKNRGSHQTSFLVAIGGDKGKDRIEIQEYLESYCIPIIAKHRTSFVADNVKIGLGSQILANSSISVETIIGKGCIINTGAIIAQECVIGDGVHIGPGVCMAGLIKIEDYATIYTGASILPRIKIGEGAVIGAGSVIIKDVDPYTVVVGNPAKFLKYVKK